MQSLWNDADATDVIGAADSARAGTNGTAAREIAERVYTSRLLGSDPTLVLHGGGNTSVKIRQADLFGRDEDILYVKGSGRDLATIDASGFAPLRIAPLLELATLPALSDTRMANELRRALTDTNAPNPSVEAILHALIPHKYVDHTHADAVLALTHTANGAALIGAVYGDEVAILPYVMPGFLLAKQVYEALGTLNLERISGIVLLNHGVFTFGATARESYERMIELVSRAEDTLKARGVPEVTAGRVRRTSAIDLPTLRQKLSQLAGFPMILTLDDSPLAQTFSAHDDLQRIAGQGCATPDHVIRTKRLPMIIEFGAYGGRSGAAPLQGQTDETYDSLISDELDRYRDAYGAYFEANKGRATVALTMLDPAPRVVLAAGVGVITAGRTARDAGIAGDIYRHTMEIILNAEQLGGYTALAAEDYFDVEYWELEQAKLGGRNPNASKAGLATPRPYTNKTLPFTGEVALVTGAASGIGRAAAESLMARGAAVVALDLNGAVEGMFERADYLGIVCDVTDEGQMAGALEATVKRFGGLDMLVLNAGIFPKSAKIASLATAEWDQVMRVNLDANLALMRETHPLLKCSPRGGRVVIVGSKNVPAPGAGAAAYSASKAALTQLARVAAFEWGADRIRINVVHPNAVFDTGIWTDEVLQARAASYGMTVEQYKTNNVLGVEVTSRDVGELIAEMCGAAFSKTTGAQVPIDGGNDRVI